MLFSHCLIVVHTKPPIFISFVLNTVGLLLGKLKTQTEALLYVYRHFFVDDVFLWLGFNVFITCQVRVCRRKKMEIQKFNLSVSEPWENLLSKHGSRKRDDQGYIHGFKRRRTTGGFGRIQGWWWTKEEGVQELSWVGDEVCWVGRREWGSRGGGRRRISIYPGPTTRSIYPKSEEFSLLALVFPRAPDWDNAHEQRCRRRRRMDEDTGSVDGRQV